MLCNKDRKGKYSKTPFYKIFDINLYESTLSRDSEFEYIPCREVYGNKVAKWNNGINRAYKVVTEYL